MSLRNPQALQDQSEWEAYFRKKDTLQDGDIQEILYRIGQNPDALERLREYTRDPLDMALIGQVYMEEADLYIQEHANEAADGKDMLA